MTLTINKKQGVAIAIVIALGVLLAYLILKMDGTPASEDAHGNHAAAGAHDEAAAPPKGPHGGKLFSKDGYGLEVTIFDQDSGAEFRLYTYRDGKPLEVAASTIALTLERLGRAPQAFSFTKEKDYLKGNAVVEEPHSFKVGVTAQVGVKSVQFAYDQVEARITMTDQQMKQNGVEVLRAGPMRIDSTLQLLGEIRFNEDRMVHIVPRLSGTVESVSANAGDQVRKGQVLAVISSQALADQRSEALAAQQRLALARTTFVREQKLWQEKISAEQDYLQARNAMQEAEIAAHSARQKLASLGATAGTGSNLTRYEIRSPIDGTVTDKRIAIGASLKEDSTIFIVADLSTVWAEMVVPVQDLNLVRTGQQATVRATAFDLDATGALSYVGALVGEQSRTATARIVLPNPKGLWRPGLPVNIALVSAMVDVAVAVPVDAVQTINEQPTVFGRYGESFEARPLVLGRSDGKFTEVLKGLQAGEQYAARNSFLIKADLGKSGASHDH